ncbi:hypothetical protein D9M72_528930 [compost metagenome]
MRQHGEIFGNFGRACVEAAVRRQAVCGLGDGQRDHGGGRGGDELAKAPEVGSVHSFGDASDDFETVPVAGTLD